MKAFCHIVCQIDYVFHNQHSAQWPRGHFPVNLDQSKNFTKFPKNDVVLFSHKKNFFNPF